MSDYIVDDVLGTPEPAPEPEVEETEPVKGEETPAPEPQEEGEEEGQEEGEERHKKNRTQRMREKIARQAEALEQANQRLAALEQRAAPQQQVRDEAPPKMDDPRYETLEQFTQALAQYEARQAVREYQASQDARAYQDTQAKAIEAWNAQCAKVAETKPDWDEKIEEFSYFAGKVGTAAPAVAQAVGLAIRESDIGPELVYYLGGKPEEMKRFAELSPFAAVREIGRLEERLRAKPSNSKLASAAPKPISPVKAGTQAPSKDSPYITY